MFFHERQALFFVERWEAQSDIGLSNVAATSRQNIAESAQRAPNAQARRVRQAGDEAKQAQGKPRWPIARS